MGMTGSDSAYADRWTDRKGSKPECSDGGMARLLGVTSTSQLRGYEIRLCAGGFRAVGLQP